MKIWITVIGLIIALLALGACAPSTDAVTAGNTAIGEAGNRNLLLEQASDLSLMGRLALGILQLEQTEQAVDETQAQTLLQLWQAHQSLSDSDTAATAELEALSRQIERALTSEQLDAISAMDLTAESLTELLDGGAPGFGGPAMNAAREAGGAEGGFSGGPPAGDIGPLGGGPPAGGGIPPGGELGGFGPGPGGGFEGDLSADQLATRQAAMADVDPAEMQTRMLTGMVIRLLQQRTGERPADERGAMFTAVVDAVAAATGLTADEVRTQMADGKRVAEIAEAAGVGMDTVRAALVEALEALPNAAEMDVEQLADQWLGQ